MMYLALWEVDPSLFAKDAEEGKKNATLVMETVKKDLDSGELKMFGQSPEGRNGFLVSTADEKTLLTKAMMAGPAWKFKIMPMLSYDEVMDVMKEMQP